MSTVTKWRPTFPQWARGGKWLFHIVADEYRAKGLCGVDLGVSGSQVEGEGITSPMCKRCLMMRSKSRARAVSEGKE